MPVANWLVSSGEERSAVTWTLAAGSVQAADTVTVGSAVFAHDGALLSPVEAAKVQVGVPLEAVGVLLQDAKTRARRITSTSLDGMLFCTECLETTTALLMMNVLVRVPLVKEL